ncbi:MAG TPA: type VII secretion protein EccCa, partial [Ktedonobacterales bacterium]|nr:type VII secretion protein EccCa [Ktedonobacterales bacterium]
MLGIIFHRPARIYPDRLPEDEIVLVAPPATPQAQQGASSWLQYVIPVVGSLGSIAFVAYGGNMGGSGRSPLLTFLIPGVAVLTAGLSILGGVAMRRAQKKAFEKQVKSNRGKYTAYVETQANRLDAITRAQRTVATRLHPDLPNLANFVARREYVWERRITDTDFLLTRVGTGPIPLAAPLRIETGNNPLMDYDQECLSRAQAVVARYSQVENAPIAISLRDAGTLAVSGNRANVRALVRSMLTEMAAFHSPDDLRMLAYFPQEATADWAWLKWLPHTHRLRQMKADKVTGEPMCLLADNVETLRDMLNGQVLPELERRRKLAGDKSGDNVTATPPKPHFVIILDGFTPQGSLARTPVLNELFREAASLGVTVLCLVGDRSDEPVALQARLEVSGVGWLSFEQTAFGGRRVEGIHPDAADAAVCEGIARSLAPLTLGEKGASRDLADDVKLLDMYGISSPDFIDAAKLWEPRTRQDLLRVPIGMRADGEPLILDVKEAADGGMGVHGLIIGATGSGKSELLRTIVTSLALTHDPETLNFVLADFKGGASFADLANLPHAAGMITNLASDLSLVDRMKAALAGEQERRQHMLREAGNLDNIKQYQAKRTMTPGMEPMPYLMIIVDEFAELLANRPDFLELFVAIGRVGRSLGMHLLLATQRLGEGRISGLEGHLRYRICLRTFSAAESTAVLNTQDAFYLPSFPGIGYFKVDTNIYDLFKTALVSTPYVPASEDTATTLAIRSFGPTGVLTPLISSASVSADTDAPRASEGDALKTDMDVIITHLVENEPAQTQRAGVHQVWLPPLPTRLSLTELLRTGGLERLDGSRWTQTPACGLLRVPVGLLDKPVEQAQQPLLL